MRRAGEVGLVLAAGLALEALAGISAAGADAKMSVTAEGGAELDSNVQQLEIAPETEPQAAPKTAPVAKLGAKLARADHALGGTYALEAGAQSHTVLSGDADLSPWNLMLLSGDLRWMHPIGERAVSTGGRLLAIDRLPVTDDVGDRTFRMLGADALIALRGSDERSLTLALGGRDFVYKPDRSYDWRGPTGSLRLDLTLWERDEGARSVELSALFEFEARRYDAASVAYASACPEGAPPKPECYAATTLRRSDRFQRGALELTWTGGFVAAASYELAVIDSNSYGQSLVRHRITLSATRDLPWRLYGTLLGKLVLDKYPDGLPVDNLGLLDFTTLDDENTSSARVRIARHVSKAWAIEGSAVIWRNLASKLDTEYHRTVVYVGAIYNR